MRRKARLSPRHPPMPKTPKPTKAPAEEAIDRAVERVYQTYGPDLSVFFQAVQNHGQAELEKHERDDRLHASD
jgi:hypothetical protein